jgi:amino acid transporter
MAERIAPRDTNGQPERDLRRELRLPDVVAIHVGNVLGSGIFVAPALVAAAAPGVPGGAGLWLLGGLIAAAGAACYAECGTRLPRCGGFYVYYREVYGLPLAFVGGWAALLVTYPASIAAIALIFGRYLPEAIPWMPDRPALAAAGAAPSSPWAPSSAPWSWCSGRTTAGAISALPPVRSGIRDASSARR